VSDPAGAHTYDPAHGRPPAKRQYNASSTTYDRHSSRTNQQFDIDPRLVSLHSHRRLLQPNLLYIRRRQRIVALTASHFPRHAFCHGHETFTHARHQSFIQQRRILFIMEITFLLTLHSSCFILLIYLYRRFLLPKECTLPKRRQHE